MKLTYYKIFDSEGELEEALLSSETRIIKTFHGEFLFVKRNTEFLVFEAKCPHQGKKLQGCWVEDNQVICPVHQYGYSLKDGKGHGMCLTKYPLKIDEKGVFIGKEKFSLF